MLKRKRPSQIPLFKQVSITSPKEKTYGPLRQISLNDVAAPDSWNTVSFMLWKIRLINKTFGYNEPHKHTAVIGKQKLTDN